MADSGSQKKVTRGKGGGAARSDAESSDASAEAATELLLDTPIGGPRTASDYEPLVTALGGVLDFPAMLAIADVLPVMTAYFDRDYIYRFINKPFAEWLGMPRKEILGKHSREIIGDKAFEDRIPMIEQTLKGQYVAAHTFRFISPAESARTGMPNPCTSCHKDKTLAWATGQLKAWTTTSPWRVAN